MYISERILIALDQESHEEIHEVIDSCYGTITFWGTRSIKHDDYYGTVTLNWLIGAFALIRERASEDVESWERIKQFLIFQYDFTTHILNYEIDIVQRIFNYIVEFNYYELRRPTKIDFQKFVSASLDTEEYKDKLANTTMIEDFWKNYQTREKTKLKSQAQILAGPRRRRVRSAPHASGK